MDIVARAKGMLMAPAPEWSAVAAESTDVATLFRSYVIPMVGVSVIGGLLKVLLIGGGIVAAILSIIVGFILACVGVFVIGKIAEFLAPQFGGPQDGIAGMKLASYAPTPSWIGQALSFIPVIGGILALIGGLYSLYLYYLGGPIVMRVPQDRALGFTVAVIVAAIIVYVVVGALAGAILYAFLR